MAREEVKTPTGEHVTVLTGAEGERKSIMTEAKKKLDEGDLAQFTGSETWYKHWLGRVVFTEGAKFVFDNAANGAYWLCDEIVLAQTRPKVRAEEFQVWILKVDLEKRSAVLRCEDGNDNLIFSKVIEYTDFALPEIKFYLLFACAIASFRQRLIEPIIPHMLPAFLHRVCGTKRALLLHSNNLAHVG
jgi:hypothetical protein